MISKNKSHATERSPHRLSNYVTVPAGIFGGTEHPAFMVGKSLLSFDYAMNAAKDERIRFSRGPDNIAGFRTQKDAVEVNAQVREGNFTGSPFLYEAFLKILHDAVIRGKRLYDGSGERIGRIEADSILQKIVGVNVASMGEWLNMRTIGDNGSMTVKYPIIEDGKVRMTTRKMLPHLKADRASMPLSYFLNVMNGQGLPTENGGFQNDLSGLHVQYSAPYVPGTARAVANDREFSIWFDGYHRVSSDRIGVRPMRLVK